MKTTVTIGRTTTLRPRDGSDEQCEIIVVACEIGNEAPIDRIRDAGTYVTAETGRVQKLIPKAYMHGKPRLRVGWHAAIIQEIVAPVGAAKKLGFKAKRGKI